MIRPVERYLNVQDCLNLTANMLRVSYQEEYNRVAVPLPATLLRNTQKACASHYSLFDLATQFSLTPRACIVDLRYGLVTACRSTFSFSDYPSDVVMKRRMN